MSHIITVLRISRLQVLQTLLFTVACVIPVLYVPIVDFPIVDASVAVGPAASVSSIETSSSTADVDYAQAATTGGGTGVVGGTGVPTGGTGGAGGSTGGESLSADAVSSRKVDLIVHILVSVGASLSVCLAFFLHHTRPKRRVQVAKRRAKKLFTEDH